MYKLQEPDDEVSQGQRLSVQDRIG